MSKPTDLQFDYVDGCVIVTASGRRVIEHKEATIKAIAAAIKAHAVKAALVDLRQVKSPYGFMDRYQLGELAGRYLTAVPIGVLSLEEQADPQRIGKLVANNRGAKIEVFTDEAAACAWLKKFQTAAPAIASIPLSSATKHTGHESKSATGK